MKALVLGAGGFIGHNLVKRLKAEGWVVHGIDLKYPSFEPTPADNFYLADLRTATIKTNYDRIYQLAADMGGAGFVFTGDNDADILTNSLSINLNVLQQLKLFEGQVFYSSSVCVYPAESDQAYPANPPSNYGWEKLTSERLYEAYATNYGLNIKLARFHNTYGPYGTYEGGREKAPAAICRKVRDAVSEIEIWGDGEQIRPFIYIDDLLDGIESLIQSDKQLVVLGPKESGSINKMVDMVCEIAGKNLQKKYIAGPTGEQTRLVTTNFGSPKVSLEQGLRTTYDWISRG